MDLRENLSSWCLYAVLLGILTFAAFGNLSTHLFHTHDQEYLQDAAVSQGDFWFFVSPERIYPGRPTFNLYLWAAYKFFKEDPAGYHQLQVWLHFLASLLVAFTFRRLGATFELSLIGGLLFLMNVAHFDPVHWISATHYILALIFGLVAVLLYSRCLETSRYRWSFAAASALAVAIFAHASTSAVTLFFLILTLYKKQPRLKAIYMLLPQFTVAGLCGMVLILVYPKEPQMSVVLNVSQPVDVIRNLFWFSGRLVTTAHWLPESLDLAEYTAWELAIGFILLSLSIFLSMRNRGLLLLWTAWLIALTLPFISIEIRPNLTGPSRYIYLSSLGSSFILGWIVHTLVCWVGKRWINLTRPLFLGCLGVLVGTSLLGLRRAEAISLEISAGTYIYKRKQIEVGLQLLKRAIARNPRVLPADAYFTLAANSFFIGKSTEPILQKALREDPASPELNMLLGVSAFLHDDPQIRLAGDKRVEEALNASDQDILLITKTGVAYNNLGGFFYGTGDMATAAKLFMRAIQHDPGHISSTLNLGRALYKSGEKQKAATIFKRLLELPLSDDFIIQWMGRVSDILAEQDYGQEAIDSYKKVISVNPQDTLSHYNLAITLEKVDRLEEAVETYETYLQFQPKDLNALLGLARSYAEIGRSEKAIEEYRRTLSISPDNQEARSRLEALLERKRQ